VIDILFIIGALVGTAGVLVSCLSMISDEEWFDIGMVILSIGLLIIIFVNIFQNFR
jgi:hypothetical protein